MTQKLSIAILGASGYTGAELVRLLSRHPYVDIKYLTANRYAGKKMADVFPHLLNVDLPPLCKMEDVDFTDIDFVFCALPHGLTQEVIVTLPEHVRIVDLSADFRLFDPAAYAEWYGKPHIATDLQKTAVYGLSELRRPAIEKARLIANPGCYPTSASLPLMPLLEEKLIETDGIIIDSKSGTSGAGRALREGSLFCEVNEGLFAYGIAGHRHIPEIEQSLSDSAGKDVAISFTPHLIPMNRGILSTIYLKMAAGKTIDDLRACLEKTYQNAPFVSILDEGILPQTRHVKGSNHCHINLFKDRHDGRVILVSVIDNLVKGASGQAIQNMNIMAGFDETLSLEQEPLFP